MRENVDRNNSEYGHFLRSENDQEILISKGFIVAFVEEK